MNFFAVFKSRNETLYLANLLISMGFGVNIVNTPKEVGQACGISVQFNEALLATVKRVVASKPFRSFYGIFKLSKRSGGASIIRV